MHTFVPVDVEVVGCREDGDEGGETGGMALAVHLVARVLGLVGPDDGQHVVPLKELAAGIVAVDRQRRITSEFTTNYSTGYTTIFCNGSIVIDY